MAKGGTLTLKMVVQGLLAAPPHSLNWVSICVSSFRLKLYIRTRSPKYLFLWVSQPANPDDFRPAWEEKSVKNLNKSSVW